MNTTFTKPGIHVPVPPSFREAASAGTARLDFSTASTCGLLSDRPLARPRRVRPLTPIEVSASESNEVDGWRRAVADSGGRIATASELEQAGL